MDIDKIRKWFEFTGEIQQNDFWSKVLQQKTAEQFFKEENLPHYDIYQNESYISILLELPGVTSKDLQISLQTPTQLLVKGSIKPLYPPEMTIKKERYYGDFHKTIQLPAPADPSSIQTYFQHGLVQIVYPTPKTPG